MKYLLAAISAVALLASPVAAQAIKSAPQPLPPSPPIATPKDTPYPGIVTLNVDATDLDHRIFRIKQTIPVAKPGPFTLLYPEWIMGNHAPRGPIYNYAGLRIFANGKQIPWTRDPENVFAFHVDVPNGAKAVEVEAQFLSAIESAQGPTMMTPEMLRLNWYIGALYPAGYFARQIKFDTTVKLPQGWDFATALDVDSKSGNTVHFKTVPWDVVIDSPLIAGKYMKHWNLDTSGKSRVTLNAMGDEADQVDPPAGVIDTMKSLVAQADKLYGARHYDHYDILLSVSDKLSGMGVEHQRSSDNGTSSGYFKQWDNGLISKDLLAHEYTHSWNGKYRRPADLWTPNYNVPMRNSLLWVYEGQTQYWGFVLAARSGLLSKSEALDYLANTAATYDTRIGREWRPVADTTMDPIIASRRSLPWGTWQRSEDYYSEGQLVWLDADTLIREKTNNAKSLDDFAKAFFGVNDGDWGQLVYQRKDLVDALNKIVPYDWEAFFKARIDDVEPKAPLAGLERGGYRLVYGDTPNDVWKRLEERSRSAQLTYSIGIVADAGGKVTSVQWDSPAFRAGLTTATTIAGVNGEVYSADKLRAAVGATKGNGPKVELLVKIGDEYRSIKLDYNGGNRYPRLERIPGKPALIDDIYKTK